MIPFAIDPEFRDLIPPLTDDERAGLEASIIAHGGARDPLVVWSGLLLDGHNRYAICATNDLQFDTVAPKEELADRDAATLWIIRNQLGRRNLQPFVKIELEYKAAPALERQARARMLAGAKDPRTTLSEGRVREQIAESVGVGQVTVDKARSLIADAPEAIKAALRTGDMSIHAAYVGMKALDKLTEENRASIVERIATEPTLDVAKTIQDLRRAVFSSESAEWYTPAKYICAAREVLGAFDLDPASNPTANEVVQAKQFFTQADDGLHREWNGRVWLNPPYGDDEEAHTGMDTWCSKLVEEYKAGRVTGAIMLVNAVVDRKWFRHLWGATAFCFTDHRIKFYAPNGTFQSPVSGNVFVYFGDDVASFERSFSQFGLVLHQVKQEAA